MHLHEVEDHLSSCFRGSVRIMSFVLNKLSTKKEVDNAIKTCEDKVLVLRFGRETDTVCQQLDHIVRR